MALPGLLWTSCAALRVVARSNVWFYCQLPSLREKALKDRSEQRSFFQFSQHQLLQTIDIRIDNLFSTAMQA